MNSRSDDRRKGAVKIKAGSEKLRLYQDILTQPFWNRSFGLAVSSVRKKDNGATNGNSFTDSACAAALLLSAQLENALFQMPACASAASSHGR